MVEVKIVGCLTGSLWTLVSQKSEIHTVGDRMRQNAHVVVVVWCEDVVF